MEAEPSRISVTLVSSVEKNGEGISVSDLVLYQMAKWWKCTHAQTHTGPATVHALGSQFRSEENQRGRKTGTQLASIWTRMGLRSEAAYFPQRVLNCGGFGMTQW